MLLHGRESDSLRAVEETERENDEVDLIDLGSSLIHHHFHKRHDSETRRIHAFRFSAVPAAGYTLQTGFAGLAVANAAFFTNKLPDANVSSILASITYSVRKQIILPLQSNIWTRDNLYNIVTDWRYLKFPSYTYGLGMFNDLTDGYLIDYSAMRLHQRVFRELAPYTYVGLGVEADYYWDIEEVDPPAKGSDFQKYGLTSTEFAAGPTVDFLYDDRHNSINPQHGNYLNVIYRPNIFVQSGEGYWQSLIVDARKYIQLPAESENVLAFWNYDWLTLNGTPPYLMLPNTGGDAMTNTGRGYIQGRYRGKNMLYAEGEYRFMISHNGLLGGVVFANAESFTEETNSRFEKIAPGYGAGIRIKLNKFSNTNIALDYGFGVNGSNGLFVNLGEVF